MQQATVILHGWSDCSESFVQMKKFLAGALGDGGPPVSEIYYADYESREDHVTYDDVIDGLNDEFYRRGFIERDGTRKVELNVIVHSTGGLVIRHWIHQHYRRYGDRIADCPVKRLVMLAPANFGSPLAHRGKSFLGSLFKGRWKIGDLLEVGRNLLDGLELASPYQWELAHRDLLIDAPYFNDRQIQLSILVGAKDYSGLRGWVNKPGTDGTVVISGTTLDTVKVRLDFSREKEKAELYTPFQWQTTGTVAEFGFAVLDGLDHGSIVGEVNRKSQSQVADLVVKALSTKTAAEFRKLRGELAAITEQTYADTSKDRFQQFILHAIDEYGVAIADFTIEFFIVAPHKLRDETAPRQPSAAEEELSDEVNRILLSEIHTHTRDPSYRRLLVNQREVQRVLEKAQLVLGKPAAIAMRLSVPDRDRGIRYDVKTLQNVVVYDPTADTSDSPTFFYQNTTTLVEMCVNRLCDYVKVGKSPQRRGQRPWS